jgi:serine/threonine protein kinase
MQDKTTVSPIRTPIGSIDSRRINSQSDDRTPARPGDLINSGPDVRPSFRPEERSNSRPSERLNARPEDRFKPPDQLNSGYDDRFSNPSEMRTGPGGDDPQKTVDQSLYVTHVNNKDNAPIESLVGRVLDNQYEILSLIGQGGMSVVYKARHNMLRKIVAIKTMLPSLMVHPFAMQRFQQEAQAASNIVHTNVITIYNFGMTPEGQPYLVMDYLEGVSLSELIAQSRFLSVERATNIFLQMANALAHAHKKGVIHRDLKPSNIILIEQGEKKDVVQIVDFGIAKMLTQDGQEALNLTQTGEVFGSPLYMSPEQCKGEKLDHRADIYSLGCLMYETLVGFPPLQGDNTLEVLYKHINEVPRQMSNKAHPIPPKLETIVFKALAKTPASRYQTMDELEADLQSFQKLEQFSLLSVLKSKWELTRAKQLPQTKRDRAALILIVLAITAIIGATTFPFMILWNLPNGSISRTPLLLDDDRRTPPSQPEEVNGQLFGMALSQAKLFLEDKSKPEDNLTLYSALMRHGRQYSDQGCLDQAYVAYQYAAKVSEKTNGSSPYPTTRAYLELGNVAYSLSRWEDAERDIQSYLPMLKTRIRDRLEKSYYYARLGNCYWNTHSYKDARKFYEQAIAEQNGLKGEKEAELGATAKYSLALACSRLAMIYHDEFKDAVMFNPEEKILLAHKAIALLNLSLPLWRQVQNTKNEGICDLELAKSLQNLPKEEKTVSVALHGDTITTSETSVAVESLLRDGTENLRTACGSESLYYALGLLRLAHQQWESRHFTAALSSRWLACNIIAHVSQSSGKVRQTEAAH